MIRSTLSGFGSLLTGMGVTLKNMLRKPVTAEYPHTEPELTEAYRSAIQLIRFDETDSHDCVACLQCEQICPSFCIKIDGDKFEGIKKKRATKFEMDFALCSLCGLCIDVCPTVTLEYSRIYDEAGYQRDWTHDLLEPFRDGEEAFLEQARALEAKRQAEKEAAAAAKKKKKEEEARKKAEEEAAASAAAEGEAPEEAAPEAASPEAAAPTPEPEAPTEDSSPEAATPDEEEA